MSAGTLSLPALGTTATLCISDERRLAEAKALLERELAEIDEACSRFRPDSELAGLNDAAGHATQVSRPLLEAIRVAIRAAAASEGLVDPTVGRTLRLAGYDQTFELVRRRDGHAFRARFASVPGWSRVEVDDENRTVKLPAGCELDLGATAKALAADRAARKVAAATGGGALVALGGDVAVAGDPPAGGWAIRIADDHAAPLDGPGPIVSIQSGGLATSGIRVRRWRAGESELHHIVDPRTGQPARTPWRTVSVAAASCVDANIASTAAVVLGAQAVAWLSRRRLPARLVHLDGSAVHVAGWPEEALA
ncbi:MAG: FAD:protein FMN transferase [Solirubrobacteraceae bacterium]